MAQEEIIKLILGKAFYVHKVIDPGMLETVYKNCLAYRLRKRGLSIEIEKRIPVVFEEVRMKCGYRGEIVAENSVIVDTKCIEAIGPLQIAQILTYLRFLNIRHGLILNFNTGTDEGWNKKSFEWFLIRNKRIDHLYVSQIHLVQVMLPYHLR
jgi:GxxExxY protein